MKLLSFLSCMELSGFIIQVWSRYPVADNNCKDTNKREQKANKFEFCRARVSKPKSKIRIIAIIFVRLYLN